MGFSPSFSIPSFCGTQRVFLLFMSTLDHSVASLPTLRPATRVQERNRVIGMEEAWGFKNTRAG